ncbi:flagellar hook-length control protein FliK [Methylobacterium sp. Leaf88]|uniref:flagellar hook-length control protein FliK n=1 Tax=Methylobacterium sp. Leaf88 TaxID=1736244 RepID=UPI0006F7074C|nr:flagellar hook-length control protein FliK [Methylobacterium sp. Leaf88]KQO74254.1 hypothetical protein ASF20_02975 [Methylobacterium sp. Leaf88]
MAVSSIDWNALSRRTASPGAVPSRGSAATTFRLDPPAPDPRPRAAEAHARDDRAAADARSDRIASQRANDAAANREAAQARDTAKAAAEARQVEARALKADGAKADGAKADGAKADGAKAGSNRTGAAGAEARGGPVPARPGASDAARGPRDATNASPGASARQDTTAPAESDAATGATTAGEAASADPSDKTEATAQIGAATPILLLPTAPPPTALASAAQGAAAAGPGGAVPADASGTAAPVVAVGTNHDGSAARGLPGLQVQAPAGRGDGSESGEPGNGKPQGDLAAALAPASDAAARTDLTPAAPAAPAPAHAKAAEAAAPGAPSAPAPAPVPLGAVPMTIGLRSLAGSNQFEIRLDPKDLGRIDVNLDIDKETGAVQARLVVDRPETLALLQRDAGNLQQALAQAGLNPGDGSINLSLRGDGPSDDRQSGAGSDGQRSETGRSARADTPDPTSLAAVPMRRYGALLGIDIRI